VILWNTVCAVKQPVRGPSQDEMAGAEAVGRKGKTDLKEWTRSSASSEWPGTVCAMRYPDARFQQGTDLGPGRSGIIALPHPSMVPDVPYTTNPNALGTMHRPQSGVSLVPILTRVWSPENPSGRVESPGRRVIQSSAPRVRTYNRPPDLPASPHNNQRMEGGERWPGDQWIQQAKESEIFDDGGAQGIT
jgi:hypothetical protein